MYIYLNVQLHVLIQRRNSRNLCTLCKWKEKDNFHVMQDIYTVARVFMLVINIHIKYAYIYIK